MSFFFVSFFYILPNLNTTYIHMSMSYLNIYTCPLSGTYIAFFQGSVIIFKGYTLKYLFILHGCMFCLHACVCAT